MLVNLIRLIQVTIPALVPIMQHVAPSPEDNSLVNSIENLKEREVRFKNDNKALTGSKSSNLYKRAVLLEVSIQSLSKSGKLGTDYVSLKNETENLRQGLVQLEEEFARLSSELINLNSELEANGLKKIRRTSSPTFYKQTIRFTKGVLNNTPSRVKNKKKVYKNFYISNIFLYITDNIRFFFY